MFGYALPSKYAPPWDGWFVGTSLPRSLPPGSTKALQLLANLSSFLVDKMKCTPCDSALDQYRARRLMELHAPLASFEELQHLDSRRCKAIAATTITAISNLWREDFKAYDTTTGNLWNSYAMKHFACVIAAHIWKDDMCQCDSEDCVCDITSWNEYNNSAEEQVTSREPASSTESLRNGKSGTATVSLSNSQHAPSAVVSPSQSSSVLAPLQEHLAPNGPCSQDPHQVDSISEAQCSGWNAAAKVSTKDSGPGDAIMQMAQNLRDYIHIVYVQGGWYPGQTSPKHNTCTSSDRRTKTLLYVQAAMNVDRTDSKAEHAKSLCRAVDVVITTILIEGLVASNSLRYLQPHLLLQGLEVESVAALNDLVDTMVRTILPAPIGYWQALECISTISKILRPAQSTFLVDSLSWTELILHAYKQLTPAFLFEYWQFTSFEPKLDVQRRMQFFLQEPDLKEWWHGGVVEMAILTMGGARGSPGQHRHDDLEPTENEEANAIAAGSVNEPKSSPNAKPSNRRAPRMAEEDPDDPYKTIRYNPSVVSNSNVEYEMRKKAAFDALDEFSDGAHERRTDASTYFESNVSSSDDFIPPANEKELSGSLDTPYDPSLLAARVHDRTPSATLEPPWRQSESYFANSWQQANEEQLQAAAQITPLDREAAGLCKMHTPAAFPSTAMDRDAAMGLLMVANTPSESTGTNPSAWRTKSRPDAINAGTEKAQINRQCCGIAFVGVHELITHIQRMHRKVADVDPMRRSEECFA